MNAKDLLERFGQDRCVYAIHELGHLALDKAAGFKKSYATVKLSVANNPKHGVTKPGIRRAEEFATTDDIPDKYMRGYVIAVLGGVAAEDLFRKNTGLPPTPPDNWESDRALFSLLKKKGRHNLTEKEARREADKLVGRNYKLIERHAHKLAKYGGKLKASQLR